ncbi:MAG: hypothetical protein KJ955_00030 [Nanoarchaeota archaeon]|nr:hypothetical protein [Nanoarchaeota archaeon]
MKFNNVLLWCEFPLRADWKQLNLLFRRQGIKARCYIAVESPEELRDWKRQLAKCKDIIVEGAWPVISLEKGYWFSSFIEKKEIDTLDKFKWAKLKIDIEPPYRYFKRWTVLMAVVWVLLHLFFPAKNKKYLAERLMKLDANNEVILSSFPLPDFLLKRYGFVRDKRFKYNFMVYTSMFPFFLKQLYRIYYKFFIKYQLKKDKETYFALGLLAKGVYNAEPEYKNVKQFKKDIKFLQRNNVRNCVVYSIEGINQRKDPEEWVKAIKESME